MPTLHDRFADLAEDAPDSPTPPGIWAEGRRRARARRLGSLAVAAATLVALCAVGGVARHLDTQPPVAGVPGVLPAIPSRVYEPSEWLGTDTEPPGRLSVVIPTKNRSWTGYTWGLVGVSAINGHYGFLDLPGYASPGALSPDGRRLAYYVGIGPVHDQVVVGLAIYDTETGRVSRWQPSTGRAVDVQSVAWHGNDTLTFSFRSHGHAHGYAWNVAQREPHRIGPSLARWFGTAGATGLYQSGPHSFYYLRPDGTTARLRIRWPYRTLATPAAVSASGRWVAAVHADQRSSRLLVGRVAAGDAPTPMLRVDAHVPWPVVVGWTDDRHLVVVAQTSPSGFDAEGTDVARYALERVDVRTGQVVRLSDVGGYWGPTLDFATDLLGGPTRAFPPPPRPMDPRLEAGLVGGVVVLGGVALLFWRRRARA